MTVIESFIEALDHLLRLAGLYHGGALDREQAKSNMMPWAMTLVKLLDQRMSIEDVKTVCALRVDAERVIGYVRYTQN